MLSRKQFALASLKDQSLSAFLLSYAREVSDMGVATATTKDWNTLTRYHFLLTHRLLTEIEPPPVLLQDWVFMADFSTLYARSPSIRPLMDSLWKNCLLENNVTMIKSKKELLGLLDQASSKESPELDVYLRRVVALLKVSDGYGNFLMVGSDLLDSLATAVPCCTKTIRKKLVVITYLSLSSLLQGEKPNFSLLLDHLYSLKAVTEQQQSTSRTSSLLQQLVSTTHFVQNLETGSSGSDTSRAKSLILYLGGLKYADVKSKRHIRRRINKGKTKDRDEYGHNAFGEVHIHQMSLVTQIQDLFPDLGAGFIVKLLDEYNENTEVVTAHLLEDTLPPHLNEADRTEQMYKKTPLPSL